MDSYPSVSILINNYNYCCYIKQAIDSALKQTYKNLEVIIVDDGSQDESANIIRGYATDKLISIFKTNGGQASAFNAGFLACHGDIICFLDSDDFFAPNKIAEVVAHFQQHPQVGWIFHKLAYVNAESQSLVVEEPINSIYESGLVDFQTVLSKGKSFTLALPATGGLCFRRNILEKILPMPDAIKITSDNYLKYAALSLSPGLLLTDRMACQRIHGGNLYTFRKKHGLRAEINVKTGYYLRQNFPHIRLFADKIFTRGCGEMLAETSPKDLWQLPEFKAYLSQYAPLSFWGKYIIKTCLHALRFRLQKRRTASSVNLPQQAS